MSKGQYAREQADPDRLARKRARTALSHRRMWASEEGQRKLRNNQLKWKYGITLDDYEAMLRVQGGGCAICGGGKERLHVDHDHATHEVRGLLCTSCNNGLGRFADDASRLRRAAVYLER